MLARVALYKIYLANNKLLVKHGMILVISWTGGVDREVFRPDWRDPKENDRPILVCVSRVSKEKNLDDFCAMQYPGARKIMVGDGPYRKELQQKYPDVEFVGFKTGRALSEYYAKADVFVFPSKW